MAKKLIWVCTECGSEQVQGKAWVNLNGEPEIEFMDSNDEEDYWCNDCTDHVDVEQVEK